MPEDAYQIGEIAKEDNINYPDENLEASHIDVGVEVYSDTRYLYIKAGLIATDDFQLARTQINIFYLIERNFPNETIKTMSNSTHHLFWLVWLQRNRFYFNT